MMRSSLWIIFLLGALLSFAQAETGQFLPDQQDSDQFMPEAEGKSIYLPEMEDSEEDKLVEEKIISKKKSDGGHGFLPGDASDYLEEGDKYRIPEKDDSYKLPGAFGDRKDYMEYKYSTLLKKLRTKGSNFFAFSYFRDTYKYSDGRGIFERTFENEEGKRPKNIGIFQISGAKYFERGDYNYGWGINIGIGYRQGLGNFKVRQVQSGAIFKLWQIPIDLSFIAERPFGPWSKVSLSGGPSIMGLLQSRSDFETAEAGKRRRQVSPGVFGELKFGVSLTELFPRYSFDFYKQYSINRWFVNIQTRLHYYPAFQDDFSIQGASFGMGMAFEYL